MLKHFSSFTYYMSHTMYHYFYIITVQLLYNWPEYIIHCQVHFHMVYIYNIMHDCMGGQSEEIFSLRLTVLARVQ